MSFLEGVNLNRSFPYSVSFHLSGRYCVHLHPPTSNRLIRKISGAFGWFQSILYQHLSWYSRLAITSPKEWQYYPASRYMWTHLCRHTHEHAQTGNFLHTCHTWMCTDMKMRLYLHRHEHEQTWRYMYTCCTCVCAQIWRCVYNCHTSEWTQMWRWMCTCTDINVHRYWDAHIPAQIWTHTHTQDLIILQQ